MRRSPEEEGKEGERRWVAFRIGARGWGTEHATPPAASVQPAEGGRPTGQWLVVGQDRPSRQVVSICIDPTRGKSR